MKLLFDENLSPALVAAVGDTFQESARIRVAGLQSSADRELWDYATEQGYTIVTKDADIRQRSFLFGPPPKVIWIGLGNCSTQQIVELLRKQRSEIETFGLAEEQAFLTLG